MVSADCELTSIFRNIGQRISQSGNVARFRDFLARGVKARELRRQGPSSRASMACRSARSYGNWSRGIARAAGIPDAVWNMDARAGGATEAGAPRSFRKSPQRAIASAPRKMTAEQRKNRPSESVEKCQNCR